MAEEEAQMNFCPGLSCHIFILIQFRVMVCLTDRKRGRVLEPGKKIIRLVRIRILLQVSV